MAFVVYHVTEGRPESESFSGSYATYDEALESATQANRLFDGTPFSAEILDTETGKRYAGNDNLTGCNANKEKANAI